jgi:DNA repair exonuclease SbcCD ATPase subunit
MFMKTESQQVESTVEFSNRSIEALKILVDEQLEKLNQQKCTIESTHSNLDLLMKRYNIKKSYFSQMAYWYGDTPWWGKILLFILVVGICIGIGYLCHIPIILGLVSCAIYIFFAFFFYNHYQVTQKQTKMLCEDILELEQSLARTIKHFNLLSSNLKQIFTNTYTMLDQMISDLQLFEANITVLSIKITEYNAIVQKISLSEESIVTNVDNLSREIQSITAQYKECFGLILKKANETNEVETKMSDIHTKLYQDAEILQQLIAKYNSLIKKLSDSDALTDELGPKDNSRSDTIMLQAKTTREASSLLCKKALKYISLEDDNISGQQKLEVKI